MTFRIGQKVIYVGIQDGSLWQRFCDLFHPDHSDNLIKYSVYTVEQIIYHFDGIHCIHLVGYKSPATNYWMEGYRADAFRPAVERKTDISVFTKMLRKIDA